MGIPSRSRERIFADLALLLAAIIWGGGFVAQREGSLYLGFFAFNAIRFLMAGLVLLPLGLRKMGKLDRKLLWIIPAGLLLFGGSALQQAGLETTSASAAGFITGLYVVLVPLFLALFWRVKVPFLNWIAALAALFGTYLLSTSGKGFSPSTGDLLVLIGAFIWPFHVIVVGLAARKMNLFAFSVGQFLVCGVLNLVFSLFTRPITWTAVESCWPALLYGGLISVAGGFTLQVLGQTKAPTADATLILSLEAVFAAIFGALLLMERLNTVQIIGCAIIMISILGSQIVSLYSERKSVPENEIILN